MSAHPTARALALPTDDAVLVDVRTRALKIAVELDALVVDSPQAQQQATALLAAVAAARNDWIRKVNGYVRDILAPVDEPERRLRDRVLEYVRAERRRQAEAEAAAERERLRAEAMLAEAERAEAAGEGQVAERLLERAVVSEQGAQQAAAVAAAPAPARTVATPFGTSSVKKVWTFRVTRPEDIPRGYLVLDEAKVRQAIRDGVREIPGIDIYQDDQLAVRS